MIVEVGSTCGIMESGNGGVDMTIMTKQKKKKTRTAVDAEKDALKAEVAATKGCLAWLPYSVDQFLREKREEVARENGE